MKARFVLSTSKLMDQYNMLESLGTLVSYSVKTNHTIGKLLEGKTPCFFSVHTSEELEHVSDRGRVWFLAESWNPRDIASLVGKGVKRFVVYNEKDLETLMEFLEQGDVKIDLMLRIRLRENTIFTGKYFVFGFESEKANRYISELRTHKNIRKLGIHFHRKTQNISEWELREEVENMLDKQTLEKIDMLNIGGGFPVGYKNSSDDSLPTILSKISELKDWLAGFGVKIIVEPGRFLSGPPIRLETTISSIVGNTITVNCSVYNSSLDTLIVPVKLLVEGELESGKQYVIKGSTPCSMDIFRYAAHLSEKQVGDSLTFLNAGAYTFHTTFCSLPELETVVME